MTPIRVLLADDDAPFRRGVVGLLAANPDFLVVGEAVDGGEALQMARSLAPDVVLMDISMPVMNGLEATRRIRAELPQVKVVILSVLDGIRTRLEAQQSGAQCCLPKLIDPQRLYSALRDAVTGDVPSPA
jgi:DNA-binding NarL/FixJ family response regulator